MNIEDFLDYFYRHYNIKLTGTTGVEQVTHEWPVRVSPIDGAVTYHSEVEAREYLDIESFSFEHRGVKISGPLSHRYYMDDEDLDEEDLLDLIKAKCGAMNLEGTYLENDTEVEL